MTLNPMNKPNSAPKFASKESIYHHIILFKSHWKISNENATFYFEFLTQKIRESDKLFAFLTPERRLAIVGVYHGDISDFNVEFFQEWCPFEHFWRGKCGIIGDGKATAHAMVTLERWVSLELDFAVNLFDATGITIAANWDIWIRPWLIVHYTFASGKIALRFTFTLAVLLRKKEFEIQIIW